jgi:hypothetical protein
MEVGFGAPSPETAWKFPTGRTFHRVPPHYAAL